jgi:hypothetical protein
MVNVDIKYDTSIGRIFLQSGFPIEIKLKVHKYNGYEYEHLTYMDYVILLEKGNEYFFGNDIIVDADNIKVEVWDSWGTSILRSAIFKKTTSIPRQKICVVCPIKNEIDILPFFIDYYFNFVGVDKIIFSDGNSDDGSVEYLKTFCSKVEVIIEDHKEYNEYNLMESRNEIWKKYKDDYDWFIIVDADEFLYHPNIREKIIEYKKNGITIPVTYGYEMYSTEFPKFQPGVYLPDIIKNGEVSSGLDKHVLFNPKEVNMRYSYGSHQSYPTGNVVYNSDTELYVLHYKHLSYDYLVRKCAYGAKRRSDHAKETMMADHWDVRAVLTESEYMEKISKGEQIIP